MRPPITSGEQTMFAPMPGLLRRAAPVCAPSEPLPKLRKFSAEARRKNIERSRINSARVRLKESAAVLRAAEQQGDAVAIATARNWVAHRTSGLHRAMRELGLDPTSKEPNQ